MYVEFIIQCVLWFKSIAYEYKHWDNWFPRGWMWITDVSRVWPGLEKVWFSCWIRLSFWARDQRGREESLAPDRQPASPGQPQQHGLLWPSFSFSLSHLFLPYEEERALPFILSLFLLSGAWQKIAQAENGTPLAYQKTHMLDWLCQKVLERDVQV